MTVVLRTATHSLTVTARRRPLPNAAAAPQDAGSDSETTRDSTEPARIAPPVVTKLWGPTRSGFVQFIDEILDAEVSLELRRVSDGAIVYAARGDNGGLELML